LDDSILIQRRIDELQSLNHRLVEDIARCNEHIAASPNYSPDFDDFRQARCIGRVDGGVLI